MIESEMTTPFEAPATPIPPDRFKGIERPYTAKDVQRLRGSVRIAHTLADLGARRLWELMTTRSYVHALGAITGNQAVQMGRPGLAATYVSGWQTPPDANTSAHTYPDQSLYPADSVPKFVKRINQALQRAVPTGAGSTSCRRASTTRSTRRPTLRRTAATRRHRACTYP